MVPRNNDLDSTLALEDSIILPEPGEGEGDEGFDFTLPGSFEDALLSIPEGCRNYATGCLCARCTQRSQLNEEIREAGEDLFNNLYRHYCDLNTRSVQETFKQGKGEESPVPSREEVTFHG